MRSVSALRFERGLVGAPFTPSHTSRLRDSSRILIESVQVVANTVSHADRIIAPLFPLLFMTDRVVPIYFILVTIILPWIVIVTALGAWGTESSDLIIISVTGLTFLITGVGLWVGERFELSK